MNGICKNMQKKIFIKTFGCQMNEYDSDKILNLMISRYNFTITNIPEKADLVILNTCSVREKAYEKVFSELGRLRLLKIKNTKMIIAVAGCISMQEQDFIFRKAPFVDIVFGPQTLHYLPQLYERALRNEKNIIDVSYNGVEKFDFIPKNQNFKYNAYITIMEGCNKYCSYCIVPHTRGIEVNRDFHDIIEEVRILANQGVKEICFLGQNVNAYHDPKYHYNLANIIEETSKINSIERIRFLTSHPKEFNNDLIAVFGENTKIASHIHLPIQSGSNRILKLMRRGYNISDYINIIDKLRTINPNISVSTDIIVGFPTETEEDFLSTMKIIKDIDFDTSFSFIYSSRPGTVAANFIDDVSLLQKKNRLLMIQNQLRMQIRTHSINMIDTIQKVLVTKYFTRKNLQCYGYTDNNRIVNFTGDQNMLGDMVKVKIIKCISNALLGEIK